MTQHSPEFSRPVAITKIAGAPSTYRIAANEAERAGLARRFGLLSLDRLEAEVTLCRAAGDIRFEAELSADLVQACVVTTEPVPAMIAEGFTLCYRPGIDEDEADRLALENPEDEIIEPLNGESVDIGEAVAQQLAVAMEPYPRAPNAAVAFDTGDTDDATVAQQNPFDALAAIRKQP
jgi:Large ribosomal RNA subunit accumulation protein YceD